MYNKTEFVYPERIIAVNGTVNGADNLLKNKDVIASFDDASLAELKNSQGERSWLVLDFGREICGGIRLVTRLVKGITANVRLVFGESVSETLSEIGEKGATNHHSPRDFVVPVSNMSALEYGRTGFRFVKIELLGEDAEIGLKSAMKYLVNEYESKVDTDYVTVPSYSYTNENLQTIISMTDEKYKQNFTQQDDICHVIACHWGPGAFGYVFVEK